MSYTEQLGTIASNLAHAGNYTAQITGTFTRPADTTAYTTGDAVTNSTSAPVPITLADAARVAAGGGKIINARLVKSSTGAAASGFRAYIYVATLTPPNDNAAFAIAIAQKATRVGYVDMTTVVTGSNCVEFYGTPVYTNGMPYSLPAGTSLFAVLSSLGSYTPASAEVFDLYLYVEQS